MLLSDSYVMPGFYTGWVYLRGLPSRLAAPPGSTLTSSCPHPFAHYVGASLDGDAVHRGPPQPARLGPNLALHERRGVLLAPSADGGGENGGLVPEHGERGGGERTSRGE